MKKRISLDNNDRFSYLLDDPVASGEGQQIEIGDWLGRGGNSAVYECLDAATGEALAIKFLMLQSKKAAARFSRETVLMKELQNAHIVRYRGGGQVRALASARGGVRAYINIPYIVMDLAERNLAETMAERRRGFPFEDYAGQFRGLSAALAVLHKKAIHRDIKPENILISGDRWLLSDYGLCSYVDPELSDLTGESERIGPKFWLSPEARNRMLKSDDQIGRASDVFQMASVFWFAATGRQPLGNVTKTDWPGPGRLYEVLGSALLHDASKRPQDGTALLNAIEESLTA